MAIPWALPALGADEERAVVEVIRSGRVTMGPRVQAFEEAVADRLGVAHAIAVTSGTAALDVALKALRIGPGDEVIVPALTYIATINAVAYQGAHPVPVDIDPLTYTLDPEATRAALTPRTRCIIAVDYGGDSAEYRQLEAIADAHGVQLLQDAAHTFGGSYFGRPPGSIGAAATLSFHAAKVITAVEGGMVVTQNAELAAAARELRNQGERADRKYDFQTVGNNYRMSELHAAVGLAQLAKAGDLLARRRAAARRYSELLCELPGTRLVAEREGVTHPWFLFSVRFASQAARDRAQAALRTADVETRICWPAPVHRQPAYAARFPGLHCPHAEEAAACLLSLPLHAGLSPSDIQLVCDTVRDAVAAPNP